MPVILEGPDNAGKSTLSQYFDLEVRHHGPYKGEPRIFYRFIGDALSDVVMDRAWYSEQMYAAPMGRDDRVGVSARSLDRAALGAGVVVVRCLPSDRAWCVGQADDYAEKVEQREAIYDAYAAWEPPVLHLSYDWITDDPDEVVRWVTQVMRAQRRAPAWGSGNWTNPRVVLVGDKPNHAPGAAFVADRGCTLWLDSILKEADIPEMHLAWWNAQTAEGQVNPLPEFPVGAQVVALGKVAETYLRQEYPEVRRVDHPQHHKWFKRHEPYELIDLLEDICKA